MPVELVGFMEWQIDAIYAYAVEKLIFSVNASIGAFHVSDSIYFFPAISDRRNRTFSGIERVRPSLA